MAEGNVGVCPQVFVVDSHSNFASVPAKKKPWWARGQKFLLLLVGLTVLGLVVQGFFIYNLYLKTEAFSLHQNMSNPKTPGQQVGTILSQVGSKESNEIPIQQPFSKFNRSPFAHLIGSNSPIGEDKVVQWLHTAGESITSNMSYDKGRLLVEIDGYYYLYSKVQVNAAQECLLIQHKVMHKMNAYGHPIELMKSKRFRCWPPNTPSPKTSDSEDVWNSFLAGIFHLHAGDHIYVTLENVEKTHSGPAYNFMGAFMISA
ncbi:tumor necrosis factor ligand superfamily member 14-like [Lates japonicus]|uniref:Tumor necrosis factor ligand superfamily member 14-like protein n=1 Tax=Lates japonicus TaxID=270547 RepID=A0AAD3RA94_LATJO|nr:tumor necrosis factor ligand superfamily member 14-like protein [Lates japonicus]